MTFAEEQELRLEKRHAKKVAKELGYGDKVIEEIDNAKTINEITRILAGARNRMR